jgi:hypothetical protein
VALEAELLRVIRHPEAAAKRPSKDAARAVGLRGSLRSHHRMTVNNYDLEFEAGADAAAGHRDRNVGDRCKLHELEFTAREDVRRERPI